ncbi:MAG: hydroxyacid dehydrogenase [Magnetovibrio sp.]|nr:hydroxyacid dehydrogenase [Magnetovibrio sp.]|tara:strand:+ start:297 stop:1706 length:1410 start_codon:yes stop_codon:yes gene_type:complete
MTKKTNSLLKIQNLVGPSGWVQDKAKMAPYLREWRGRYKGSAAAVIIPGSTEEVAQVLKICNGSGIGVVPQGGNTGLVGGSVPNFPNGDGVIVSTQRLNTIRNINSLNQTMTVEAGVILAQIQREAEKSGLLFPLSLAAEGSCCIGGNIATNAGGVQVLRYGNTRNLVLGLEVVLADGRVWDGLRNLRKDNTGYDLKHLFMGAEGSLGIITAAVLKLHSQPQSVETTLCGSKDIKGLLEILQRFNANAGNALTAFEVMNRFCLEISEKYSSSIKDPFQKPYNQYALIELSGPIGIKKTLKAILEKALKDGVIEEALIAKNRTQSNQFWAIRKAIPEAQKHEGGSIKHDVSVPISCLEEFLTKANNLVKAKLPGVRICAFGHAGDGNIHYNLSQPVDANKADYMKNLNSINRAIHDLVMSIGGSFGAEHGIGQLKRNDMKRYKSDVELDLMRTLKKALDPSNTMNPGKVI